MPTPQIMQKILQEIFSDLKRDFEQKYPGKPELTLTISDDLRPFAFAKISEITISNGMLIRLGTYLYAVALSMNKFFFDHIADPIPLKELDKSKNYDDMEFLLAATQVDREPSLQRIKLWRHLVDLTLLYIMLHETAHIARGHLYLLESRGSTNPLQPSQMRALEYDADFFAIRHMMQLQMTGDHPFPLPETSREAGQDISTLFWAIFCAASVHRLFDTGSFQSVYSAAGIHPPSLLRLEYALMIGLSPDSGFKAELRLRAIHSFFYGVDGMYSFIMGDRGTPAMLPKWFQSLETLAEWTTVLHRDHLALREELSLFSYEKLA